MDQKTKNIPAQLDLSAVYKNGRLSVQPSKLSFHNLKLEFSGAAQQSPAKLRLRVRTAPVDVSDWNRFLIPVASYEMGGKVDFDLTWSAPPRRAPTNSV